MPSPDPRSPAEAAAIVIRRLGFTDLPQVVSMERRAFAMPWSTPMFVLEFSKPSSVCLGALLAPEGPLAGYAICSRYADVWHLMNIAVDPPLRRRGIGRRLLEAVIEQAGPEEPVTLEVRPSNAPAIAL
jgi:ribosomal-protein-alanine N-acetyltransferase